MSLFTILCIHVKLSKEDRLSLFSGSYQYVAEYTSCFIIRIFSYLVCPPFLTQQLVVYLKETPFCSWVFPLSFVCSIDLCGFK